MCIRDRSRTDLLINFIMRAVLGTLAIYFINMFLGSQGFSWHVEMCIRDRVFILCEPVEGEFEKNIETLGREWFTLEELPVLSEDKTTKEQIAMCFEAAADKDWKVLFD